MRELKRKVMANKNINAKNNSFVSVKNGKSGITLIALVITIIVLLILAGVSIVTLTGENGILTKAQTAETTNNKAQAEEEIKLVVSDWQLEKKTNKEANLKEFLDKKVENGELDKVTDNKDGSYTIERNGYEGTINADGELEGEIIASRNPDDPPQVESLKPGEEATKTEKDNYTDGNKTATIPEGFKVSEEPDEQSVDTGLVVIAPDGSEFVWVPVPYAIATGEETAIDAQGNRAMAVKDPTDENFYRGLLYDFKGTGTDSYSELKNGCTTADDKYWEPAYLTHQDYGDVSLDNTLSDEVLSETTLKAEYKAMVKSVETYGGFYVGRYETSIKGNNVASVKDADPMNAGTDSQKWYGMYENQKNYAKKVTQKDISNIVESSMIWGSQYDAIMNWMLTSETEKIKVNKNSTPKGTPNKTGENADIMNNICDLGNNFYEWTLEAYYNGFRIARGGFYYNTNTPSSRESKFPNTKDSEYSSRLTLYIK